MSHYNEQREADEIWKNAPVTATHYGGGKFWRMHDSGNCWETECGFDWVHVDGSPFRYKDLSYRPQSHTKPDWSKAPAEATHYADGSFLQRTSGFDKQFLRYNEQTGLWNAKLSGNIECYPDYQERPKPHQNAQDELKPRNPYRRTIIGLDGSKCVCDVYRVLDAFKTDSPALDHAVKKILCPGTRHQKDREQDLKEAIKSIEAELLLMEQR